MATIMAHIRVLPHAGGEFERLSRDLFEKSHGSEPDLLRYEYFKSQDPDKYYCLLAFKDYQAFLRHRADRAGSNPRQKSNEINAGEAQ